MVQIHQAPQRERQPSFGEIISSNVNRGLEMGSQMYEQHQQRKMAEEQQKVAAQNMKKQKAQLSQLTGMDLNDIEDPKILEKAFEMYMSGQNQKGLEQFKQQGRTSRDTEKQSFLSQILAGNQSQNQSPVNDQQMQEGQSYDPSQISDAQIAQVTIMDPALGRELRYAKDSAKRDKLAREKLEFSKEKSSPEYQRQQHLESSQAQADVKYNQQLQETSKQHELKERSLERLEKLNKKGVTGKPWEKLAEKAGLINITSEGRREFAAEVKSLITDIRSILGGQFSNFEFQTILNAYPSADFSKDANSAIIKNLKEFQEIKKKEVEYAQSIKKQNNGKLPVDFQSLVNEKVREYTASRLPEIKQNTSKILNEEYGIPKGHTLMFDMNDEPLSVSDSEVNKYLELGASLP